MVRNHLRCFNFKGPSMNPTLKTGDSLRVTPYGDEFIRAGDVIVFRPPGKERHVTHRVVSVNARGIRTRGDNNRKMDPWLLQPCDITGRVVSAHRGTRTIYVHGGKRGVLMVRALWFIRYADAVISSLFRPVYRRLSTAGMFRSVFPKTKTRLLCFKQPGGVEMQLLMGSKIIGRRRSGEPWRVRRPFRLFVNEASLPDFDVGVQFPHSPNLLLTVPTSGDKIIVR
jgi:signal peptidase I